MQEVRPASVLVRIEASALMSYLKEYVEGKLPAYNPPKGVTPGSNGVGVVHVIGRDVWHLNLFPTAYYNDYSQEPVQRIRL